MLCRWRHSPEHRGKIRDLVSHVGNSSFGRGRRAPATKRSSENKRRLRPGKCVQNAFAATHRLDDADTIASSFAARDFLSNSWWDEFLARGSERNGSGGSAWRLEVSKMSWSVFEVLLVS